MSEVANYEQSIKRLEEIVTRLESGRLPLEDSISLYNEGIKLSAECRKTLESASLTVNVKDDE